MTLLLTRGTTTIRAGERESEMRARMRAREWWRGPAVTRQLFARSKKYLNILESIVSMCQCATVKQTYLPLFSLRPGLCGSVVVVVVVLVIGVVFLVVFSRSLVLLLLVVNLFLRVATRWEQVISAARSGALLRRMRSRK